MRLPPWGRRARRGGTARATEGPVMRGTERGSLFVVTASHEHGTGGFGKCDSWRCAGTPIATPAKRHTGARHRAARARGGKNGERRPARGAREKSSSQRSIELRRRERRSTYVGSHSGTPCEVASVDAAGASVAASASSARRFCRRRSCCRSFEPAPRLLSAHPAGTRPRFLLSAGELTAAAASGAVAAARAGLLAISSWVPAACSP